MKGVKKILLAVLSLCIALTSLSLAACSESGDNGPGGPIGGGDKDQDGTEAQVYSAVFVDADENPIPGVKALITTGLLFSEQATSDEDGKIALSIDSAKNKVYLFIISVPEGYAKPEYMEYTSYHAAFIKDDAELSIMIEKLPTNPTDYTVEVLDQNGDPVSGVTVTMTSKTGTCVVTTDDMGIAHGLFCPDYEVRLMLSVPEGYSIPQDTDEDGYIATIEPGKTVITVIKGEE